MSLFRAVLLAAVSVMLSDCSSIIDSLSHGFYLNSSTVTDRSRPTTSTQLGYRLGIPL